MRVGGYVPAGRRAAHTVTCLTNGQMVVGQVPVPGPGFSPDTALQAGKAFARELNALSMTLAKDEPPPEELETSLTLDGEETDEMLGKLQEIGVPLRLQLSRDVLDEFRSIGFLREQRAEREPALTFLETGDAPVLWEMLCEGELADDPNWENFWGFRVPITHWICANRNPEIRLRHGIFSATHEGLRFAGREVELLQRRLLGDHGNLAASIRARVEAAVRLELDAGAADLWWQQAGEEWLKLYLAGHGVAQPRRRWVENALIEILDEGADRELLHFACHCEPSDEVEFLSALQMSVCGEDVSLTVSRLLRERQAPRFAELPGPLVFLNACGTGQQGPSREPPGFPSAWIQGRGAIAVVATLCPVPDHFAYAFAKKFYELLLSTDGEAGNDDGPANGYLDEVLLATRRHFMGQYGNPLGLAYVLYAYPNAHVEPALAPEHGP